MKRVCSVIMLVILSVGLVLADSYAATSGATGTVLSGSYPASSGAAGTVQSGSYPASSGAAGTVLSGSYPASSGAAGTVLTASVTGKSSGYDYELWKDYGTTRMELGSEGAFSCEWSDIGNALFRTGRKYSEQKKYTEYKGIAVEYSCDYQPQGNSYLCVYGWSRNPLVEYYIVDSWGTWRPPGAQSVGQIKVDGGTYDVYETTRVNQPSIDGNTTFKQYWSVRTTKRTAGTISVSEHFRAWERLGMELGALYETSLTIEGYQSRGSAVVKKNVIILGTEEADGSTDSGSKNPGGATTGTGGATGTGDTAGTGGTAGTGSTGGTTGTGSTGGTTGTGGTGGAAGSTAAATARLSCGKMKLSGPYAGKISAPFSGVALYANGDSCFTSKKFSGGSYSFYIRGCSNNSRTAAVDLVIDGIVVGTVRFKGSRPVTKTIKNIRVTRGAHEVRLTVAADDGTWDAYVKYVKLKKQV